MTRELRELDALPDAVLTLAIPGTKEEAQALQELLPVLLADALGDFDKVRRDVEGYVARGYVALSDQEKAEKVEQVRRRLQAARALHNVVLRLTVEPL